MNCPICENDYQKNNTAPIVLSCGHTICLICCEQIIKNSRSGMLICPFDKKEFAYSLVKKDKFPKNYELLRAIEDIRVLERQLNKERELTASIAAKMTYLEAMNETYTQQSTTQNSRIAQLEAIVNDMSRKLNEARTQNVTLVQEKSKLEANIEDLKDENDALRISMDAIKQASQTIVTQIDSKVEENKDYKSLKMNYELLKQLYDKVEKENRDLKSYWIDMPVEVPKQKIDSRSKLNDITNVHINPLSYLKNIIKK